LASDGATHVAFGTQSPHSGAPYDDSICCLAGFPSDHFVQATMYDGGGVGPTPEVELLLRASISAHSTIGYEVDILHSGRVFLAQWLGSQGSYDQWPTPFTKNVAIRNGAAWRAQIVGNLLSVTCDAKPVVTNFDITKFPTGGSRPAPTGSPGIGFWTDRLGDQRLQTNRRFAWSNFSAGGL